MIDRARFAFVYSMIVGLAFIALVIVVCKVIVGPAAAQEICGDFSTMKKNLADQFGEVATGGGMVNEQGIIVLFQSPDGTTWTLLGVRTNGTACVISDGKDWGEMQKPPVAGEMPS